MAEPSDQTAEPIPLPAPAPAKPLVSVVPPAPPAEGVTVADLADVERAVSDDLAALGCRTFSPQSTSDNLRYGNFDG